MPGHGPIPTAVRLAVDERDHRACVRCGLAVRHLHHRMRRREGGHAMSVVISTCAACHRKIHANPTEAKRLGYIVPPWGEPTETPIKSFRGWIRLDNDGNVHFVDPPEEHP